MLATPSVYENDGTEGQTNQAMNPIDLTADDVSEIANIKVEVVLSSDTSVEASDGASESEVEAVRAPPVKRRTRCGIKLDGENNEVRRYLNRNKRKFKFRVDHPVVE